MKRFCFPFNAADKTKSLIPAYFYGFFATAAVALLPLVPMIPAVVNGRRITLSLLTLLTTTISALDVAGDPKNYLLILDLAFPIVFIVAAVVSAIKFVVKIKRRNRLDALKTTSFYFAILSALVGYVVYSLFFNSLIFTFDEFGREFGSYVVELSVALYGKYYIIYGSTALLGVALSLIGNYASPLLRPKTGEFFYRLIRFALSVGVLTIVCALPVFKVSYYDSKASLTLFSFGEKSAYLVSEAGIFCNYGYLSEICAITGNAFVGGEDIMPVLLLSLFVYLLPTALTALCSGAALSNLERLVQPSREKLCSFVESDGATFTEGAYEKYSAPEKLGYTAAVMLLVAAAATALLHFGFAPFARATALTVYTSTKFYFAPFYALGSAISGVTLIIYAAAFNSRINALYAAARSAQAGETLNENAIKENKTDDGGAAVAKVGDDEKGISATPTLPVVPDSESAATETVTETDERQNTGFAAYREINAEAPFGSAAPALTADEYARVKAEYESYIDESNDELRRFYAKMKTLKKELDDTDFGITDKTCKQAEYDRTVERKRSYVYESGLVIQGYKKKLGI